MKGRRTQFEIYWEILTFCRNPRTFTSIIGRCNLNTAIAQQYIEFLTRRGHLSKSNEEDRTLYRTSEAAKEYLSLFTKMYKELFDSSPEFKLG